MPATSIPARRTFARGDCATPGGRDFVSTPPWAPSGWSTGARSIERRGSRPASSCSRSGRASDPGEDRRKSAGQKKRAGLWGEPARVKGRRGNHLIRGSGVAKLFLSGSQDLAKLALRLAFELADPLAREAHLPANLFQRHLFVSRQAEAIHQDRPL